MVSRAEDRGSEIALYMKELAAGSIVRLPYRLEATAVCDVLQLPARAYAYYSPELNGSSAAHRLQAKRRWRAGKAAKRARAKLRALAR
jgi:hypothetical protein